MNLFYRCSVVASVAVRIDKVMSLHGCCSVVVPVAISIEKVMVLPAVRQ